MLYFSELDKIKVFTNSGKTEGVLDDLIFAIEGTPYIKKLVVLRKKERTSWLPFFTSYEQLIIPAKYLQKINHKKVLIDENFKESSIEENELYVKENLLDTQVIDIEGNNIVRVNDILIQSINSHGFAIYGADIGISGVLRWFGLEKYFERLFHFFKKTMPQRTLAWSDIQPLELSRGRVVLNARFDKIKNLHPADLADYLERQNFKDATKLIEGMDKKYLARVLTELNPQFQISLIRRMPIEKIAFIISILEPDDAVDIISQFSEQGKKRILEKMQQEEASKIRRLLSLSSTSLGEYLNTKFLAVDPNDTAKDIIQRFRKEGYDFPTLHYIYVVNKEEQLLGVFDFRELLIQDPNTPIFKFMASRVIVANLNTSVEVATRRMMKYKISALPVVDHEKRIIGIVSMNDLLEGRVVRF